VSGARGIVTEQGDSVPDLPDPILEFLVRFQDILDSRPDDSVAAEVAQFLAHAAPGDTVIETFSAE
jgi:hypothetical protein